MVAAAIFEKGGGGGGRIWWVLGRIWLWRGGRGAPLFKRSAGRGNK